MPERKTLLELLTELSKELTRIDKDDKNRNTKKARQQKGRAVLKVIRELDREVSDQDRIEEHEEVSH